MDDLKDFPPDFSKPFAISFNYIGNCNIRVLDDNAPFWQKYWRFVIMAVVILFQFVSMWLYIIRMFDKEVNISELAFMTSACMFGLQSILKACLLLPKKGDIENFIKRLAEMWKTEDLNDFQMKKKNRCVKKIYFGQLSLHYTTAIALFQNVAPQLISTVLAKIREEDFDFKLPFGNAYPFDPVKNWGRYIVVYFLQCYSIIIFVSYYFGVMFLLLTSLSQLSTEFAILRDDLKYAEPVLIRCESAQERNVEDEMPIEILIQRHQELIKLAKSLNKIFSGMIFIDLCFYAVIMCFFAIILKLSNDPIDKIRYIMSIASLLFLVYLFCFYSEKLKEESAGIAESAYVNPWYEADIRYQKIIKFIIMRAQAPCYLTSMNYAPITLNTFTKVVSTTWSYFSLAMTMFE